MTEARPSSTPRPRLVFLLNSAQRRLQAWMGALHAQTAHEGQAAPTAAQAGVLFVLARQDGTTMGQLATELNLAPSAVSGLIQRLEALAWVQRRPCPEDARTQRVWLQARGRAQLAPLRKTLSHINEQLTAGFTEAELQTVARWLTHVQQLDATTPPKATS
ncbi:MAG: MarR family transcriptional regulator [Aquabacterium sp.]|uniref:MarR family winged helix-turn-helix transcriptional regulator n=1 Tax=Aquabacterium sp. TaxID=1872578 RepID=UPI0025C0A337|nr:MarR family transcriptional regulator [Aquabacterium sp.]MBI5925985.1 MarR family transcriptional regulator [Aquabacterium sp.]